MTLNEFETMTFVEKARYLQELKVRINRSDNYLLKQMMGIAEEEVVSHLEDFYIRDIEMLSNSSQYLWILSSNGTLLLDLNNDDFEAGQWINKKHYFNFLNQHKVCGHYLIDTNYKEIKHISNQSALATLTIYEDMARSSYELKQRVSWLFVS